MASAPPAQGSTTFPKDMAYQRSWRTYQARLLDRLDSYLDDDRLHIVAAPGSGKTIFGLEVVRRLNRPALVLAPTITIRDQWVQRLVEQFLPTGSIDPDWISTDIRNPQLLTVATYQALHALCSGEINSIEEMGTDNESCAVPESGDGNGNGKPGTAIEVPESLSGFM